MEGLKDAVDTAGEAAERAEKFPWGTSIVIALLAGLVVYLIMKSQVQYANARADKADEQRSELVEKLLMKNNIIDNYRDTIYVQREIIQTADSANKALTVGMAVELLNSKKRTK